MVKQPSFFYIIFKQNHNFLCFKPYRRLDSDLFIGLYIRQICDGSIIFRFVIYR